MTPQEFQTTLETGLTEITANSSTKDVERAKLLANKIEKLLEVKTTTNVVMMALLSILLAVTKVVTAQGSKQTVN